MTALGPPTLQIACFGDLDAGIWGAAWVGEETFVAVATPGREPVCTTGSFDGAEPDRDWRLTADGFELTLAPAGDPVTGPKLQGFDQLSRAHGEAQEQQIDCLARRALRPEFDQTAYESARDFSAWFEPTEGVALTALRSRGAAGHDSDLIIAALLASEGSQPVADPRLSTSYSADGVPVRASLELWLEEAQEAESEAERYPRRAAGEALGAGASTHLGQLELRAQPLRCFSRGLEGSGVYLLARVR